MVIVLAYFLEKHETKIVLYFPIFGIIGYGFYFRFTKGLSLKMTKKVLTLCSGWSLIVFFSTYIEIAVTKMNKKSPSALQEMFITYCFTVFLCFLYKVCGSFPIREKS